jgi:hypothetical protein
VAKSVAFSNHLSLSSRRYFSLNPYKFDMESPVKKFFTLNLFVMRLLGFYPSRRFKQPYRLYSFAVYIFFTIPVPTLAAIHLLADKDVDLTQVYDSSLFQLGCFIFKLVPFVFNVDNVRESIYMLEWPIFNNYTTEQEKIIEKCVKTCKRNTWLFLGFCVVAFLTWAAKPFFQHGRGFPIEIWLPSNINVDTRNYVLIFLFIFFGMYYEVCVGLFENNFCRNRRWCYCKRSH